MARKKKKPEKDWAVAFLGAGSAARGLARGFRQAGLRVAAVYSRDRSRAEALMEAAGLEDCQATAEAAEAASLASLVILAVPDKAIRDTAAGVAREGGFARDALVVHLSGALPAGHLDAALALGARIGALHPLLSFTGDGPPDLRGVTFALEGDDDVVADLTALVRRLGGVPVRVEAEGKRLYHAAAAMVSNFTVTIFDTALSLFEELGIPREPGMQGLASLLRSTLANIDNVGVPQALTGPVARGDVPTVEGHIAALKETSPALLPLYAALGLRTVDVAERKGTLRPEEAEILRMMFARHV